MALPKMGRVTEPDENLVHYVGPSIIGNVTLCGLTDFLHAKQKGKPTRAAVNCAGCKGTLAFVYQHQIEEV